MKDTYKTDNGNWRSKVIIKHINKYTNTNAN